MDILAFPILISALATLSVVEFKVLPPWFYNLPFAKHKPFTCITCFAFWLGILLTLPTCQWYLAPVLGLAASATTVIIREWMYK
jgi:hypothetical protein